ncbi:EF-hand domain-containing protein [Polymorphobacter fuscus]|uniref:Histidine kinase n=1 Tax=Sandarakinorhabdus fusca TaxID=1439888 RepID=A0A7C9GNL9_9SPHN|nr:EF-hand domain-containing protein [Polymorphobacter fuscus]KAB7648813.1 histidine kinase [Polymorphobacter fuscus]MQT16393.1 histidine kinase [Polymorphobacter fuscus]NJC07318.1 Ca2+-binding EF-hand superfamily protein [Polymorphobacter fuscus]
MRRFLALAVALVSLIAAGFLWTRDRPVAVATEAAPAAAPAESEAEDGALVAPVSDVTPADREARRFARYDKNRDAEVSRDEYLASRRKAFARLDTNGDGRLAFEEYAVATVKKFGKADRDGDGNLDADEFATTAAKRRAAPACQCSP